MTGNNMQRKSHLSWNANPVMGVKIVNAVIYMQVLINYF